MNGNLVKQFRGSYVFVQVYKKKDKANSFAHIN